MSAIGDEERPGSASLHALIAAEFPSIAPALDGVGRRSLLKAMAASLALAGLAGCDGGPDEEALPYVNAPENLTPGKAKWYATAVTLGGYALPVLGKTYAGRPVKLEGNPNHPASSGGTDPFLQASLLGLYDPGRSQAPLHLGQPTDWSAFAAEIAARASALNERQGEGFRLLTGAVTSPTLQRQIEALLKRWPKARWHAFEPAHSNLRLEAARMVFGRPLEPHLSLDRAEVVVSLDDDLLGPGPHQARHASLWARRRLGFQNGDGQSRLLVAEPTPSLTGTRADDRLIVAATEIGALAQAIAAGLGVGQGAAPNLPEPSGRWVNRVVAALKAKPGRSVVTAGPFHAPEIQALAFLINERIGAIGETIGFSEPVARVPPDGLRSFATLVEDMTAGRVDHLAIFGTNPVHAAPGDVPFRAALERIDFRLHAGLYNDETARLCDWHLPVRHDLEDWSDARAVDGSVSILQPLIRPFLAVRSSHAVLAALGGEMVADRDPVRATWRQEWGDGFEARWQDALYRGVVQDSATSVTAPAVVARDIFVHPAATAEASVVIRPDPTLWDGRFANNAWLQELPKPLTKVTWGNVIAISPAMAAERGLANGAVMRIGRGNRFIRGPVHILPGQEARTIALTLGYGREDGTGLGGGLGYNAAGLLAATGPWHFAGPTLDATGEFEAVASTQTHQAMDGFDFVRVVDAPDSVVPSRQSEPASFYPARKWDSPSWGMSIDLDLCIGCNACVAACTAENNVPVVGKELVAQGREMAWLRVDHYHEGDAAAPKSYFQPVPCMHCEEAPCEMGCPVNAAVHSSDGLNLQVYNRCIGTRTCAAYCPYKVRHFNWFDYTAGDPDPIRAMRNPEVTVRERGVMEKCTYCVQRIRQARIAADLENRPVRDGEIQPACQQACPTQAIVFGDVTDPKNAVSRRKAGPRDYSLLEEVGTRPRTTYLARIEPRDDEKGAT